MKWIYGIGLAVLLAGYLIATHTMTTLLAEHAPDLSPVALFLDLSVIPKLITLLCMMGQTFGMTAAVLGVILAVVRQPAARIVELLMAIGAAALVVLGLLGGLYNWINVQQAIAATGTTNPAVLAPSHAEILITISAGLFAGLVLLGGATLIRLVRAWRKPVAAQAA